MMKKILYGLARVLPDKMYLSLRYRLRMKKWINWRNPQTFNEKLQWLKLHDRKALYTQLVDKYEVKAYVAEHIGDEYIIPSLGVWERFDDIDFENLPDQFVLKCTHDSGGVVICRDKACFDREAARVKIEASLSTNYYDCWREWPYKNVKPRIIAEAYIADNPKDYKLHCFDGETKMVLVCSERFAGGLREDFFDRQWTHLDCRRPKHANADVTPEKPKNYEKMCELAQLLTQEMRFARVDFYEVDGRVYFGEITFYPASGMERFEPEVWDRRLGEWIRM